MLQAYLGLKFHADGRNRPLIEAISRILHNHGWESACVYRDLEHWGERSFAPRELMRLSFELLENSECVLLEMSEKGVGLGIEAGYAIAKGKPLVVALPSDQLLSTTLSGIADEICYYRNLDHLSDLLDPILTQFA